MDPINLFDIVELMEDIPGTRFRAGMEGTVIHRFPSGGLEVEFEHLEEELGEMVTHAFYPHQLRVVMPFAEMAPRETVIAFVRAAITTTETAKPRYSSGGVLTQLRAVPRPIADAPSPSRWRTQFNASETPQRIRVSVTG